MLRCRQACNLLLTAVALSTWTPLGAQETIRIATFNVSLYGQSSGEVLARLQKNDDAQAKSIAAIVQKVRPDILLLNEIDFDEAGSSLDRFADDYVANGVTGIDYPHRLAIPSNTGIGSGLDLNGNGVTTDANDAWGYGTYPGQYAMAILSQFPIKMDAIRSFQTFRWRELPGAMCPLNPVTHQPYYSDAAWARLRLSSKNHIDVPIQLDHRTLHLLASHPTPPVFDGVADRNGCRNHDEIRFWTDYLGGTNATHLIDDLGIRGGLAEDALFVVAGDLNSDPLAGDSRRNAIQALLSHPRIQDPNPASPGAAEATGGTKSNATAWFGGNRSMRVDYVLPSRDFNVQKAAVFWPTRDSEDHHLMNASDHRLVWVEVELP